MKLDLTIHKAAFDGLKDATEYYESLQGGLGIKLLGVFHLFLGAFHLLPGRI